MVEAQTYQLRAVTYEKNDLVQDTIHFWIIHASALRCITVEMNNAAMSNALKIAPPLMLRGALVEAQAYQHWTVTYEKNDLVPDAIVRCAFYASTLLSITVEMNNAIKGMGASRKRGEYAGSMPFELWVYRRAQD